MLVFQPPTTEEPNPKGNKAYHWQTILYRKCITWDVIHVRGQREKEGGERDDVWVYLNALHYYLHLPFVWLELVQQLFDVLHSIIDTILLFHQHVLKDNKKSSIKTPITFRLNIKWKTNVFFLFGYIQYKTYTVQSSGSSMHGNQNVQLPGLRRRPAEPTKHSNFSHLCRATSNILLPVSASLWQPIQATVLKQMRKTKAVNNETN